MSNKQFKLEVVIVLLLASIFTFFVFYPIILNLNDTLLVNGGDGIKNYYTYLYHTLYGTGSHFEGMNYPYGEHVVFTDNMPLLTFIASKINMLLPGNANYAVGILHFLLLISIPIASVFAYKILRHFKMPSWLSIVTSIIIIFSCQQYAKISGHFGMAFLCYLPMQLYWLIQYHDSRKKQYLIWILLSCVCFSFFHLYNLALTAFLLLFYILAYLILNAKKQSIKKLSIHLIPVIVVIFIGYLIPSLYLKWTDLVTDRPNYPYGVFGGATEGKDIFLNQYTPLGYLFQFAFGRADFGIREGSIYLGLVTIVTIVAVVLLYLFTRIFKKYASIKNALNTIHPKEFNFWLLVAFFALLLGMGFPISSGWTSLIDYISTLRQFRTVGRFSWIFYFIMQVYTVVLLYRFYSYWALKRGKKRIAQIACSALLLIAFIQSTGIYFWFNPKENNGQNMHQQFFGKNSAYNIDTLFQQQQLQISDFQSIVALPFFHVGSEKLWVDNVGNRGVMADAMSLSIQTGLPMSDVMMSRTSWSQTFEGVNIVDGPFSPKEVLKKYNDKKVLIIKRASEIPLYTNEEFLVKNAHYIGDFGANTKLYALDPKQLVQNINALRDSVIQIASNSPQIAGIILPPENNDSFYYVDHFENRKHPGIIGNSYRSDIHLRYDTIASFKMQKGRTEDVMYQFLVWTHVNDFKYNSPEYLIDQLDENGNLIERNSTSANRSTLMANFWFHLDMDIAIKPNTQKIIISVNGGSKKDEEYYALDELLFIPQHAVYYLKQNGKLYLNNRLVEGKL